MRLGVSGLAAMSALGRCLRPATLRCLVGLGGRPWWPAPPWPAGFPGWPCALGRGLGFPSPRSPAFALGFAAAPAASFAASSASLAAWVGGRLLESLALGLGVVLGLPGGLRGALATERDVVDAQDRQLLAMALLDPAAGLGPVLERDQLLATRLADDLGADLGARDQRTTDRRIGAVADEQDPFERDRLARLDVEELDLELGADLDAILLSAGLDDCVHGSSGASCWRPRATTATSDREMRSDGPSRRSRIVRLRA